jgi:hypothetical protein
MSSYYESEREKAAQMVQKWNDAGLSSIVVIRDPVGQIQVANMAGNGSDMLYMLMLAAHKYATLLDDEAKEFVSESLRNAVMQAKQATL